MIVHVFKFMFVFRLIFLLKKLLMRLKMAPSICNLKKKLLSLLMKYNRIQPSHSNGDIPEPRAASGGAPVAIQARSLNRFALSLS